MKNPAADRSSALRLTGENLKAATAETEAEPSLQDIYFLTTLVECLYEQNKVKESRSTLEKTQETLTKLPDAIENNHYREIVIRSDTVSGLENVRKLLSPE